MNYEVKMIDGVPVTIRRIVVHQFIVDDFDVPTINAADPLWQYYHGGSTHPLWQWQQTEQGKWVMENALEKPEWHRQTDFSTMSTKYAITVRVREQDAIIWALKWGN
jgi:hypothetical protein